MKLLCQKFCKRKDFCILLEKIFPVKPRESDNFLVVVQTEPDENILWLADFYGKNCTYSETKEGGRCLSRLSEEALQKIIRELINKYDIRKDRIMKKRATAILLGIMVSSMFLSACGKQ